MSSNIFGQIGEKLRNIPREVGTEVVGQFKGGQKQQSSSAQDPAQAAQQQQNFLQDLYGVSPLTEEQTEQRKKQENKKKTQMYEAIQDSIKRFRAEESQKVSKHEAAQEEGAKAVETQEERQELWQEQQEKAKKRKEEQEKATGPGSKAAMGGEQAGNKG